jgi:hypothetical protein
MILRAVAYTSYDTISLSYTIPEAKKAARVIITRLIPAIMETVRIDSSSMFSFAMSIPP